MAKIKARGAIEVARFEKTKKNEDGTISTITLVLTSDGRVLRKVTWRDPRPEPIVRKGCSHVTVSRKLPLCEHGVWLSRVRSAPGWVEKTKAAAS